ncbi:Molybdopterin-guanine dinucleotide biosynthesis protein A [Ignavibacterium album JCM 16511]|uniref:Probable molybdenum cofactor guanylyltransferase n=1 Tax=Ignavibacterium album (strain DSM 19864 / JCM 16511 / NBRC 101810 / Mat9-16) TaxID=945713 RepID=I0ANF1_IGNAJ|nr:molybdenum cofactor guanylyltransferase [Ignavibacterium album]AFH50508.1 Molybdopterin-guanine dinucleotide biosynthesis protein A [Ignavibacterium album JCM 16511]
MYSDITGVILAGGKSSRMGTNKSFLKIGNQTIIERIVDLMKSIFSEVIIITNSPEEYRFLNLPLFEDIYKWRGPLAGIHSALVHSTTDKIFVLSCDVPLMSREMIEYIANHKSEKPIVFCEAAGYHQPLVGVYAKVIMKEVEKFIASLEINDKSFHHFLKNAVAEIIHPKKLSFYRDELFFNVNRPEDFKQLKKYFTHNN